jgi:hypothetical protein
MQTSKLKIICIDLFQCTSLFHDYTSVTKLCIECEMMGEELGGSCYLEYYPNIRQQKLRRIVIKLISAVKVD